MDHDQYGGWISFWCIDLQSGKPVQLPWRKRCGPPAGGERTCHGHWLKHCFRTLEPDQDTVFRSRFPVAGYKVLCEESCDFNHAYPQTSIVRSRRYRLGLAEGEWLTWWREGRRDNIVEQSEDCTRLGSASGQPINLALVDPVEFEVL